MDVGVVLIQNTAYDCLGRRLCGSRHIFRFHDLQRLHRAGLDIAVLIQSPAHYTITGTRHNEVSGAVDGKGAVSGEEVLGAAVNNEKGLARNHDIPGVVRRLGGTLSRDGSVDRRRLGAETDLSCVDTASSRVRVGTGSCLCCLVEQVAEYHVL